MGMFRDAIKAENMKARSALQMTQDFSKDRVRGSDGDSKLKGFNLRRSIKNMMGRF